MKNVVSYAQSVASAMTNNASFPSPNPTLAQLEADVAALATAEAAVLARTKGAAEMRNTKLEVVRGDLEKLKTYVQGVADAAPPANAEAIVQSAGMGVRKRTLHNKAEIAAKQGSVSGSVNLAAKAPAKRAAYAWQYSTDQKTWTSIPQTLKAKTGVSGLTAGTTYYFPVQVLTKTGESNVSQVTALLVK